MRKWKRIASLLALGCCISLVEAGIPVYGSTITEEGYLQESRVKEISLERLYGGTRFETAKVIADYFAQGQVENVVLTTGHKFADALSASVLAYELGAPILLVDWTVEKSSDAFNFIRENLLPHGNIYIIGGTGIISEDFVRELRKSGYENLIRIAGQDRYDTSLKIASYLREFGDNELRKKELEGKGLGKNENDERKLQEVEVQTTEVNDVFTESETKQNELAESASESLGRENQGKENQESRNQEREINTVVIASGEEYPDALSISGIAANQGWPILLSPPHGLTENMKEYLQTTKPDQILILGGEGAISREVVSQIQGLLPASNLERINGQNRLATNVLIARTYAGEPHNLFLATGYNFADALAGSLLAARHGDPIVYIDPSVPTIPKEAAAYFEEIYSNDIRPKVIVLGGKAVVSDATVKVAQELLTGKAQGTDIYGVDDLYVEIFRGNSYSLPSTVTGRLYNSEKITLPVTWKPSFVDNKVLGLQVFEGFVAGYNKPIKLNLLVKEQPLISEYTTYFNDQDVNRTENIRLAAKAIDGKVLGPGEVFSFNETVGQRTEEAGYKQAIIIQGRTFVLGLGGGICQVSSTLYNAVDLAQLEILERHHHSLRVTYVPPGKDAAVYYGVLDFRFRNNTKENLVIRTSVVDNALTMKILRK